MHNDFTLFKRKAPSGEKVVYYYAYDDAGKRRGPWTTGETGLTAARNVCNRLNRENKLLPGAQGVPLFAEYAADFWDWEKSAYLKDRRKRYTLAQSYTDKNVNVVNHTLAPYFGKMRLDKITPEEVEIWVDYMLDEEYMHSTINGYFGTLLTMVSYAAKKKVIPFNPLIGFERLVNDRKNLEIITPEEFRKIFVNDWKKVWNGDLVVCMANKLAALTGMRCSEVLGLTGEYVFDNNIFVNAQYDGYGYRETKTKVRHYIPLVKTVIDELGALMRVNGKGYLFSLDGGATPVNRKSMFNGFIKALKKIGFTADQIKKRGLNLHAWRHFCVTELQNAGLTMQQVMAVTGHKSERMTEIYTHFDPAQFGKMPQVQESLLRPDGKKKPDRPDDAAAGKRGLTLVKMPEKPEGREQKRA